MIQFLSKIFYHKPAAQRRHFVFQPDLTRWWCSCRILSHRRRKCEAWNCFLHKFRHISLIADFRHQMKLTHGMIDQTKWISVAEKLCRRLKMLLLLESYWRKPLQSNWMLRQSDESSSHILELLIFRQFFSCHFYRKSFWCICMFHRHEISWILLFGE